MHYSNTRDNYSLVWPATGVVIAFIVLFLLQSCAGSGKLGSSGNSRIYQIDYDSMVKTAEQAIKGIGLVITNANETEEPFHTTFNYALMESVGSNSVQRHRGKVEITEINASETEITIENPDYHYAVSETDRVNYRRIIFDRIDDILD